jgi:uncharacterized phosphosugar-binding protein
MSLADHYLTAATALLEKACAQNAPVLKKLGPVIGESLAKGGMLHLFGSGHSEIISREIIGRAGGLMCITGISDPTGGFIENLAGYGTKLAERYDRQYGLLPGETIVVISNSGKNSSPIEVALYAKARGLHVVGLTCVEVSRTAATVHPGGKNLHAIAGYVLDNCGVPGDAIVPIDSRDKDGLPSEALAKEGVMAGPTSTLIGATLLNLLSLELIAWLKAGGHPLPILRSQNLPGAIEYNRELAKKYRGRLSRQVA